MSSGDKIGECYKWLVFWHADEVVNVLSRANATEEERAWLERVVVQINVLGGSVNDALRDHTGDGSGVPEV